MVTTSQPTVQPTAPRRPRPDDLHGADGQSKPTGDSTIASSRIPTISNVDASSFSSGKGGGALRSIDQKFEVNPCNGTLTLNLPLYLTHGRNNFHPDLNLSYNSGSGHSPFGIGWNMSFNSITRKTTLEIPRYSGSDTFLLSGLDDLIAEGEQVMYSASLGKYSVQIYRPRAESGDKMRIEKFTSSVDENDVFWRTISANNVTNFYGRNEQSRIMESSSSGANRIFSWLLCEIYDPLGNAMLFSYKSENDDGIRTADGSLPIWEANREPSARTRARYLKSIKYGNVTPTRDLESWQIVPASSRDSWMFEVIFDFGEHDLEKPTTSETKAWDVRKDPSSIFSSGFEIRSYRLCRRILFFHHFPGKLPLDDYLVYSYNLQYDEAPSGSLLSSVTSNGHLWNDEKKLYDSQSLAPYTLVYEKVAPVDSLPVKHIKVESLQTIFVNQPNAQTHWIDLNGEGAPGLLVQLDGAWYYQRNENAINMATDSDNESSDADEAIPASPHDFGPVQLVHSYPLVRDYSASYFEDLDGNGHQDLVLCDEAGRADGYYECYSKDEWESHKPFPSRLNFNTNDNTVRRVDLTGNGRRDVLFGMDNGITWYQSLGKDGFDFGGACKGHESIQMMMSHDERSALFFVDASGDGLADALRISNGRISYCPNSGYGRFGSEVVMGNAPLFDSEDQFTFQRLHLLDIDGTGTTDLVYLTPGGGAIAYFNLCGNTWSDGVPINCFPEMDNLSSIFSLDLLGSGTSCLCWARPGSTMTDDFILSYLDLTSGVKPHLLKQWSNGIGLTASAKYTPSTKFYLQDEREGRPWKSKLPFPIHTVSRLVEKDEIALSVRTTKFRYHDGYFDGREREFRGFAMAEKWEYEEFTINRERKKLKTPTCYTKEWYHTGAQDLGLRPSNSDTFDQSRLLSSIPQDLPDGKSYDAYRALKGRQLRSEVYGQDQSTVANTPYSVAESSYDVIILGDTRASDQPVTFRVQLRETLVAHYERQSDSPRIEHDLIVKTNLYGDITKSMKVNYGKQGGSDTQDAQLKHHIIYTEIDYATKISSEDEADNYYKPIPSATKVSHINDSPKPQIFDIEEIRSKGLDAVGGTVHTGQQTRTYFRSRDLARRLEFGSFESFSILDQQYQLAMDKSMCEGFLKDKGFVFNPQDMLFNTCGYVDISKDGRAWIPSPEILWEDGGGDGFLKYARKTFFTPKKSRDAFGNVSEVKMDEYNVLPLQSIDSMQNTTTAEYNYRVMQAILVTDPNGNRVRVVYDAMGEAEVLAHMGKVSESVGDSVDDTPLVISESEIQSFISEPSQAAVTRFIGKAGSRTLHCRTRLTLPSSEKILPTFRIDLARTEHALKNEDHQTSQENPGDILVSITYLTGRGAESQQLTLVDWNGAEKKWRVTSHAVEDGEGETVLSLKPYFSPTHLWQSHIELNKPFQLSFIDALQRSVGTLHPDHTWTKQCFTPWTSTSYDAGDTILVTDPRSDQDVGYHFTALDTSLFLPTWYDLRVHAEDKQSQDAAAQSAEYANKPQVTYFDSRGKAIKSVEQGENHKRSIRSEYDVFGNRATEFDSLDRQAEKGDYDILGRLLASHSMDSGTRAVLLDSSDKLVLERDSAGRQHHFVYDALQRKTQTRVLDPKTQKEVLWSEIAYGDHQADAASKNLRLQVFKVTDQSGLHKNTAYDFKGNCLSTDTYLALEYRTMLDWQGTVEVQETPYTSSSTFDALNRAKTSTDAVGRVSKRSYDLTGGLKTLHSSASKAAATSKETDVTWSCHVSNAVYAADGQPLQVDYGNNSHSAYAYDEYTRQLTRRKTWRDDGTVLEDLTMTYECLGRISSTADAAQQTEFFRNQQVAPLKSYHYDAFARLVKATGRETVDAGANTARSVRQVISSKYQALPFGQSTEVCNYVESYNYDDEDNILSVQHQVSDASIDGWTRTYHYNEPSLLEPTKINNRLSSTQIAGLTDQYSYTGDAGMVGCMTSMPGFSRLGWDCNNKLQCAARQKINDGVPETTWYVYGEDGRRVRKVTDAAYTEGSEPRKLKETIFLDSLEIYHTYQGDGKTAKSTTNTSLISPATADEGSAVVSIEDPVLVADKSKTTTAPLFRYHVSTSLETDEKAQTISYEEYSPFGVSVLQGCKSDIEAPRRYRFAGYRRDNESGFYACGARYYAPWLGRWTSPDPLGTIDGYNVFAYVRNDPVNWVDPDGTVRERSDSAPPDFRRGRRGAVTSMYGPNDTAEQRAKVLIAGKKAEKKMESWTDWTKNKVRENKVLAPVKVAKTVVGLPLSLIPVPGVSTVGKFAINQATGYLVEDKIKNKQKKAETLKWTTHVIARQQAHEQDVMKQFVAIGQTNISDAEKVRLMMDLAKANIKGGHLMEDEPIRQLERPTRSGNRFRELERPPRAGRSAERPMATARARSGAGSTTIGVHPTTSRAHPSTSGTPSTSFGVRRNAVGVRSTTFGEHRV
ncbi:hypothetical protein V8C35DRAFT_133222 [Trichoderma chlorosporum]